MERAERSILKKATNGGRLKTMMAVDFRRLFTMRLLYIMVGICLVVPILVLVMTTMMDGSVSVDPKTGAETAMHAFSSVWQSIGSTSGSGMMSMDMTSMCNINLVYFAVAVFICLFVSDDFRSGYAKNLFAVRAGRMEYVISKTLAGVVSGALMLIAYFIGSMLGGKIAGLSFAMEGFTASNIVMCMLAKCLLIGQSSPDAERLILIANALKTTPNYLLGFTDDPAVQPYAADELGLLPASIDEFRRIKEAGLSDMLNYFIREGEYVGSLMGILNCFAEILDAHRNQKYLSLRETTGIPDSCYHPLGYLRVVADAEEKIKKEIYVKNVRVLIENDLQDYLKYRAHLWLDEQIRFMIQDDPKKGTV